MPQLDRLRTGMRLVSAAIAAFTEATTDYERLLEMIARRTAETIHDACSVLLLEPDGSFRPTSWFASDPLVHEQLGLLLSMPLLPAEPSTAHEAIRGAPVFLPVIDLEVLRGRIVERNHAFLSKIGVRGMMTVGMKARGQLLGILCVFRHRAEHPPFDELDLEIAQDLASHAALAIDNARLVTALRATEELRGAKEEVLRANQFLDAIIEHIPDMVFVKDADRLAFTRFNRAGEELLGVSRDELLGKTDHDLFPPGEAEFFQAKDRETLRNKDLVEILEEPIQTRHGPRWLHTKKVPILYDEHGDARFLLGISQDITERKLADAELRAAKESAEAANGELEAFSYSVAHDLRSPLRGIDGFSQALLEDYGDKLDDVGRRYLSRVREAAQRMALLIDDLLALSKVSRAELHRRPVDISALAHAAITRLQRADPDRHVEIEIAPGLTGLADARLLAIALDNLFGNAWKFTSKVAQPRIELGRSGDELFVRDNGAGFDMEYVHKLFGVFQRLHAETEFPGTGIGLVTVARIIHRHGGHVRAEGVPGAGATFYFTLSAPEAA